MACFAARCLPDWRVRWPGALGPPGGYIWHYGEILSLLTTTDNIHHGGYVHVDVSVGVGVDVGVGVHDAMLVSDRTSIVEWCGHCLARHRGTPRERERESPG